MIRHFDDETREMHMCCKEHLSDKKRAAATGIPSLSQNSMSVRDTAIHLAFSIFLNRGGIFYNWPYLKRN